MAHNLVKSLDDVLAQVKQDRRGFLKAMLIGSAVAAAVPLMTSEAMAAEGEGGEEGKKKKKKKKEGE